MNDALQLVLLFSQHASFHMPYEYYDRQDEQLFELHPLMSYWR